MRFWWSDWLRPRALRSRFPGWRRVRNDDEVVAPGGRVCPPCDRVVEGEFAKFAFEASQQIFSRTMHQVSRRVVRHCVSKHEAKVEPEALGVELRRLHARSRVHSTREIVGQSSQVHGFLDNVHIARQGIERPEFEHRDPEGCGILQALKVANQAMAKLVPLRICVRDALVLCAHRWVRAVRPHERGRCAHSALAQRPRAT
mmetsp:Transcript_377/g.938  ORF Transcript_377/g.938 Transcript_377/m.938 type:complete len:201 (+) Transcript_377:1004-1606(+)